jgi:hypothetical protein
MFWLLNLRCVKYLSAKIENIAASPVISLQENSIFPKYKMPGVWNNELEITAGINHK